MKQLLAISWEMPPLSGPRAVQVTRTLLALAQRGWHSRTICFDARSQRYQQDYMVSPEDLSGGAVRRLPVPSPEEWLFFRALWRLVPPLKHLPDEKRVWMPSAIAEGRRALGEQPVDVVVSFGQPWSDHLVGLALHRDSGVPWVAHFSDPWIDSPYQGGTRWTRHRAAAMEREVVSTANRLVFVNRQTLERVMRKYPEEWKNRAHVVPQGHEGKTTTSAAPRRDGPLRIVYTGRFYEGVRTPELFLEAIAELHRASPLQGRLEFELVGAHMEVYERLAGSLGVAAIVRFPGRMSPQHARHRASEADALLIIDAASTDGPSLFLPSKLIDYLPLKKPILAITPLQGPVADVIAELGYVSVAPGDKAGMTTAVMSLVDAHERGILAASASHDTVSRAFDIGETTAAFERVLDLARHAG
ncbi:MAG TPA: glycosyltransferase [Vicinamibacterales bacterium]